MRAFKSRLLTIAMSAALVSALAGCASSPNEPAASALVPKKNDLFATPDWAKTATIKKTSDRTVTPEDLIDADGSCAAIRAAIAEPPPQPLPETVGTNPATPDGAPVSITPQMSPPPQTAALPGVASPDGLQPPMWQGPTVHGGISLAMTECEVAQRAGRPTSLEIGADPGGERSAALTYLQGPWPGLYRFRGGRLVSIERVALPEPPKPARTQRKSTPVRVSPKR